MALNFRPQSGRWNDELESVRFDAVDGTKPVMCLIHKVALADLCHLHEASRDDLLAGFEKQRPQIERIAAWKYSIGAVRGDGDIFISAQDIEAFDQRDRPMHDDVLIFDSGKIHYDPIHDWVRFYASDDGKQVSCAVTKEALMDRERLQKADEPLLIDAYRRSRQAINAIATRKYDTDQVESDGVVVVRANDLSPS
jgi:uncharacterized protein DUF1488